MKYNPPKLTLTAPSAAAKPPSESPCPPAADALVASHTLAVTRPGRSNMINYVYNVYVCP